MSSRISRRSYTHNLLLCMAQISFFFILADHKKWVLALFMLACFAFNAYCAIQQAKESDK